MDKTFSTRVAQQEDGIRELLARMLGSPVRATGLASATRTATTSTLQFDGTQFSGLIAYLNVTAASGAGGLIIMVQYLDPTSGLWMSSLYAPSAPRTTTGTFSFAMGRGISAGTGSTINTSNAADRGAILGSAMRLSVLHSDASSYTYSLGYELVP